ncbi:Concanavalin A-like lectin protein kinase family protein [Rhynchospora pubera]|uniref:non-specific serine/threonine protein kinase n=1 Tax=Rhynchospora pubera TaxID=906938 RepID=A0AAV8C8J6_9POAL|nr:Concanavalin A-like lectin protein kinase family protein [Rhynchospora pubera]
MIYLFIFGTATLYIYSLKETILCKFGIDFQFACMPEPLNFLFLILFLSLATATSSNNGLVFNGFTNSSLILSGIAQITSSGLLLLTNYTKEALGHAFHPTPINFIDPSSGQPKSFSTTFVFAIVPQYPDVTGHGLAFVISPSKDIPGSMPSQNLGLVNTTDNGNRSNHLIAVELDTVLTVEYFDIDHNHVGIDVNSMISLNSSTAGYYDKSRGQFTNLTLVSGDAMQVWIDYTGDDMRLEVRMAPINTTRPEIPLVTSLVNFSDIVLDEMFVGFSSSTGAASGLHYVSGWSFSLQGTAQALDISNLPSIPRNSTQRNKSPSMVLPVVLPLTVGLLVFTSVIGFFFLVRRIKKFAEIKEDWELEYGPHRISYKDLFDATKGFNDKNLIGSGGFGQVYKGTLPKSRVKVAVKRISHHSKQGVREFVSEIASLSRLRHRNLVQLLGYCRRQGELFLVYDFVENGSLDKFLFDGEKPALRWSERFKVIKDVATGLLYLHEGWEQVVVHRDIKASNVLLDANHNGKLSDFGLARLYDHGTNPQTTHIVGTLGYLAPEISRTGKATTSSDVFAFGVFLLEVVCAKRPMEHNAQEDVLGLVESVLESWKKGNVLSVVDPNLECLFDKAEAELVLKLGLLCSHPESVARPSMRQVMQFLEGSMQLPELPIDSLGSSARLKSYGIAFDYFLATSLSTSAIEFFSDEIYLKHS